MQPRAKKSKSKWLYFLGSSIAILGISAGTGWIWWNQSIGSPLANNPRQTTETLKKVKFQVQPGMTGQEIGQKLQAAGIIRSFDAWKLWTLWQQKTNSQGGFKAGTYEFSANDTLPLVAGKIWRGEVVQAQFTIPEGWSIQQMANYFQSLGYFPADKFIEATNNIPKQKYDWLPDNLKSLEGFLYPDTYKISSDRIDSPQDIINTMLDRFSRIALPAYEQAKDKHKFNLLEWVTLASIVEKEAVIGKERPIIAGVFHKRLDLGMRLESDPTVEYGLGIRQTKDQPLTYKQVGTPSPYNTYLNTGLPPAPIASPGIASLKATLSPDKTEYLYFVARYDGTHVFSKTLTEHEAAVRAIQR